MGSTPIEFAVPIRISQLVRPPAAMRGRVFPIAVNVVWADVVRQLQVIPIQHRRQQRRISARPDDQKERSFKKLEPRTGKIENTVEGGDDE